MDEIETSTPAEEPSRWSVRLARLRLRFRDPGLESAYRDDRFRHNLGNIRFAFLAGIALWVAWGLLLRPHMLALSDQRLDLIMRFGVFIPMLLVGFGLTYTRFFGRVWEWVSVAIAAATILFWVYYVSRMTTLPAEYGYVGVILITAFTYTLLRLRFVLVVLVTVIGIVAYLPYAFTATYIVDVSLVLATLYLVSFGFLGGLAAYRLERFTRELFLRERQLEQERTRSDGLLLNMLPAAIVEQLKTSSGGRIAQSFDHVSVFFADAVGSTEQAARSIPGGVRRRPGRALPPVRRDRHAARPREDQDDRRRVHGRRRRADPHGRSRRGGRRDGGRDPRRRREDQMAVGRPDRGARRDRHRAGRRRSDRGPEVRVRPVGRHREPREQAPGERGARPGPGLRVDGSGN